jgi:hypothetical protein
MARKGTPGERKAARIVRRQENRAEFVRVRATKVIDGGKGGHQLVVVACNAALAASKRITDTARRDLATAIAMTVERFDVEQNWKEQR